MLLLSSSCTGAGKHHLLTIPDIKPNNLTNPLIHSRAQIPKLPLSLQINPQIHSQQYHTLTYPILFSLNDEFLIDYLKYRETCAMFWICGHLGEGVLRQDCSTVVERLLDQGVVGLQEGVGGGGLAPVYYRVQDRE